jgi:diguanylate cyclase (GGDEF)-like protein
MTNNTVQTRLKTDQPEDTNNIVPRYLAVVVLFTLLGMTAFEILKMFVHAYFNAWEAPLLTILFSTAISGGATYFALHRYTRLNQRLAHEIEIRKKLEEDLIVAATVDKLTQIYNRRKLEETIEAEIERAKRYDSPLSLIMLDIDDFKHVNDTYGHQIGDDVLKAVADILKNNIRLSDTAGRWGGEEFIVVVPETTSDNARELAEKVRKLIATFPVAGSCTITISLGLTQLLLSDTFDSFLKRVDDALYQAKRRGKNRVETFY